MVLRRRGVYAWLLRSACVGRPVSGMGLPVGLPIHGHDKAPKSECVRLDRFDNLYLDEELRVSYDSRGDTLITRRAGPPRRFT